MVYVIFVFKQKTAYEMRISDWSSDVCSSDLVRIPGVELTVVSADGQPVEPVTVEEFRIGPGETYDVEFTMPEGGARTIFAQAIDRSGYARGTIAPAPGMAAAVPPLDAQIGRAHV